jgi:hypothetical protein
LNTHPQLTAFIWNRAPAAYAQVVVEGNRWLGDAGTKLRGPGQIRP